LLYYLLAWCYGIQECICIYSHNAVGVGIDLPNLPWTSLVAVHKNSLTVQDSVIFFFLVDVALAPSLLYSFYEVPRAPLRSVEY
jgi:hypothetical protein